MIQELIVRELVLKLNVQIVLVRNYSIIYIIIKNFKFLYIYIGIYRMIPPIYLQDYKVESKEGNVNYSVVGALPNEIPGVETKQFTWNFVSHMVLDKCSRFIRIKYHFKDTEFQKEITFEYKLMGTVQLGSKVYNAGDIMKYQYNKELLEMELIILFPLEEKICGKDLSWNIFINDYFDGCWSPYHYACYIHPRDYGIGYPI